MAQIVKVSTDELGTILRVVGDDDPAIASFWSWQLQLLLDLLEIKVHVVVETKENEPCAPWPNLRLAVYEVRDKIRNCRVST